MEHNRKKTPGEDWLDNVNKLECRDGDWVLKDGNWEFDLAHSKTRNDEKSKL